MFPVFWPLFYDNLLATARCLGAVPVGERGHYEFRILRVHFTPVKLPFIQRKCSLAVNHLVRLIENSPCSFIGLPRWPISRLLLSGSF